MVEASNPLIVNEPSFPPHALGFVPLTVKLGVGFTVTVTEAVSEQLFAVVETMKYVPAPTEVGSATTFVAVAFVK